MSLKSLAIAGIKTDPAPPGPTPLIVKNPTGQTNFRVRFSGKTNVYIQYNEDEGLDVFEDSLPVVSGLLDLTDPMEEPNYYYINNTVLNDHTYYKTFTIDPTKEVKIYGTYEGLHTLSTIKEVIQWGETSPKSLALLFYNNKSLTDIPSRSPDMENTESLFGAFAKTEAFSQSLSNLNLNTSKVKNLSHLFAQSHYNQSLSFDTSNVTDMSGMFICTVFS